MRLVTRLMRCIHCGQMATGGKATCETCRDIVEQIRELKQLLVDRMRANGGLR